ncbi:MAG: helicase-exonuclease AddAB subunit AddA [Sedimentisphaerales bacterium]|nr:helicase-exonuclease AddAB subunit AddA [Sedimentisphaerales bacterium]
MKWTERQKQAIELPHSDITVTASAGTGKTSVLSHRAVRIISDADFCPDVSGILVLTFTEAAAGEMNQRIAQCLRDAALKTKDAHLRKQLLLLDSADISTIHSFCRRVIVEHFHRLDLDPAVRVMDADESELIKREILGRIIEQTWTDYPQGMHQLLQGRAVSNPSKNFLNCIIDISKFLDTVVSRPNWFDRALVFNDTAISSSCDAVKNQKQDILEKLKTFKQQFEWSLSLDEKITNSHWRQQLIEKCIPAIDAAVELLEKDDLKGFIKHLNSVEKFKWKNKPKGLEDEKKMLVQTAGREAIEGFRNLSNLAILNPDYNSFVAGACSAQIKTLIELVKRFDLAYQQRKNELGCVDFADLEKYMLKLLSAQSDIDAGQPSDTAVNLQKKYKYIFVDEYQDINPVQQKIIDLLSGQAKVFVVGDIKQSIYAWRGADCSLFADRLISAKTDESKSRVDLNENFRSRPGILNFINQVFTPIMTESVAMMDYDEDTALKPADNKSKKPAQRPDVELILVEEKKEEQDQNNENDSETDAIFSCEAVNRRALTVANRIKELVEIEKFEIYDKTTNSYRPCRWSDFAILTRAFQSRANNYVQVLRSANIPVISDSSAGYFETTEINDMLSLLQVLDNPRQDIPLASVLRSPIFSLSDTELASIKNHQNEKIDFYSLLESVAKKSDDKNLQKKVSSVLQQLDSWRTLARHGSLADLIWQIYSQTDLLIFVSALPAGAQRHANLLKLHQRAIQFENFASSYNCISLSRFVDFLQKLLESGGDWAPAEPDSSAANAVRIMSIHKSKGLEFPIVILAETNREFRFGSHIGDCITDNQVTLGLKIIAHDKGLKLPSLTWQIISEKQRRQSLAEEMRILYVAMTRAREKLILSGSIKSGDYGMLNNASLCDLEKLPSWLIEKAKSELDWILFSLAKHKKLHAYFRLPAEVAQKDENIFDLIIYSANKISQLEKSLLKKHPAARYDQIKAPLPDKSLLEEIEKQLNWQCPFENVTSVKAKQSVTSIAHAAEQFASADRSFSFESFQTLKGRTDSLVIGSATHLVLKNMDLNTTVNSGTIRTTIANLVDRGYMTKQTAESISISSVLKFFDSELGKLLLNNRNTVSREWPFTYALPVLDLYPGLKNCEDEKIIVQGVVDMLIKTPEKIIIIDFKTDRIKPDKIKQRAQYYLPQIKWYCKAAGGIFNRTETEGFLYFLNIDEAVKVC